MRRLLAVLTILAMPAAAFANTVEAKVSGMVCAFCAQGIETKLREEPAVQDVAIDLDTGMVKVTAKPGATISEDTVRHAVDYMGYKTESVRTLP